VTRARKAKLPRVRPITAWMLVDPYGRDASGYRNVHRTETKYHIGTLNEYGLVAVCRGTIWLNATDKTPPEEVAAKDRCKRVRCKELWR